LFGNPELDAISGERLPFLPDCVSHIVAAQPVLGLAN
jgi:hypothetical protein